MGKMERMNRSATRKRMHAGMDVYIYACLLPNEKRKDGRGTRKCHTAYNPPIARSKSPVSRKVLATSANTVSASGSSLPRW
jgi:hypothetical protein